jgi:hypothetical protein
VIENDPCLAMQDERQELNGKKAIHLLHGCFECLDSVGGLTTAKNQAMNVGQLHGTRFLVCIQPWLKENGTYARECAFHLFPNARTFVCMLP